MSEQTTDTQAQATQASGPAPAAQGPQAQISGKLPASYYFQHRFTKDLADFQACNNRLTGYSNLDDVQPLYPGFYCVGAISSLGKTTFIHQMADQIAAAGTPVLYFSLEQSAFELYSKSIARTIYQRSLQDISVRRFSSIDIRRGAANGCGELQQAVTDYTAAVANRVTIVECNFAYTVEEIEQDVVAYMSTYGVVPIVIIDYLQIISPTIVGGRPLEGRASIDHIVHNLKCFQRAYNLTLIAICSLNRQNYMVPVDFESFKESGGIEYTADVIWGLQLTVIHDEIFSKEGKIKEKREKITAAKTEVPRKIELVTLKNRYGQACYSVDFEYNSVYDTFTPVTMGMPAAGGWEPAPAGDANPFA